MKIVLAAVTALALTGAAYAAPPTAEQETEFYAVCFKISENATLCQCKVEAARQLIDSEFMAIVIASMKDKPVEAQYYDSYNNYIARSTEACGMGSAM